jgi:hypothetical protein
MVLLGCWQGSPGCCQRGCAAPPKVLCRIKALGRGISLIHGPVIVRRQKDVGPMKDIIGECNCFIQNSLLKLGARTFFLRSNTASTNFINRGSYVAKLVCVLSRTRALHNALLRFLISVVFVELSPKLDLRFCRARVLLKVVPWITVHNFTNISSF